ncbi:MAG: type III secretion system chaperone [Turicibacter sp.]
MSASHNLLKEFCQSIGMEGLGLDDAKQRSLCFDDKIVVTFVGDDTDVLTALCYIHDLPKEADMRRLLEENFLPEANGGGRFSLEPKTDRIIITRCWDATRTPVPEFSNDLEALVNAAMQAQKYFEAGGVDSVPKTDAAIAPANLANAYEAL